MGNSIFFGTFNTFLISPQLQLSQSLRYNELRAKQDSSIYFKGYIARLNINYQFNQVLSFRIIGEYNDFDDRFFVQPLLKWNPNPFTIFYIGGNNAYTRIDQRQDFHINNAQYYLKFQYLFDL